MIVCKECKKLKLHCAKGLCRSCYKKQKPKINKICKKCGKLKTLFAKGLCQSCYRKQIPLIMCKKCGKLKLNRSKGLCVSCYRKQKPLEICKKCGELKQLSAKGLCKNCYMICYTHEKGLNKAMSENKSCASYLGVFINEQLLSKIFKDVKQMPYGNKGYDFLCSKNKKVDAKSSVTKVIGKYKIKHWRFTIRKNKIADYFFCVAYTIRENPEPVHMWLIPSEVVNDKVGVQISETTLYKWSKYEQPLDKALLCCTEMKRT